jgi:hypothetical protein
VREVERGRKRENIKETEERKESVCYTCSLGLDTREMEA